MPSVSRNQHRWRLSVADEHKLNVIDGAREHLTWAWETDHDGSSWSYPVHTDRAFSAIRKELEDVHSPNKKQLQRKTTILRLKRTIEGLSELISDRTVEIVYESQNSGSYKEALNHAAFGRDRSARLTLRRILKAAEKAFEIDQIGIERLPKPRIHLLHRRLLELADQLGLSELTHAGILEFLNDLCPCNNRHTIEAIRKLRKRTERRKSKS
jgi:hypothetical protein